MQATLPIQFRFLLGAQSRLDNSITVVEGYLTGGDASDLGSHFVVDFVTDCQKSQQAILRGWTEINRTQKYFIKVEAAKPPMAGAFVTQGVRE